jgi:predicted Zn-dependent protease
MGHVPHGWSRVVRRICAFLLAAALCGCGKPAHEHLADARRELADAAYPEAIAAADAGLRETPGAKILWGLELVKLEAHARAGQAEEAKGQLTKLVDLYPDRIPATQYSATAYQLQSAGQGAVAIEVLDMAMQHDPGNPVIERLIGASRSGDVDPAELEMLKTLGYIE